MENLEKNMSKRQETGPPGEPPKDENDFLKIKNSLLSYYNSQLTAQSARLIGFSVALFTLLELAQNSSNLHLSNILSNASHCSLLTPLGTDLFRFVFLFTGTVFIVALIVRTLGRFSVFAQISEEVLKVTLDSATKKMKEMKEKELEITMHQAIHRDAVDKLIERNVGIPPFRTNWFTGENSRWLAWIVSAIYGVVVTTLLLGFLW
jgi:hypothetical protein